MTAINRNPTKHQGIVRKGGYGFFYPECSCGWHRSDGFASEEIAASIAEQHVRENGST